MKMQRSRGMASTVLWLVFAGLCLAGSQPACAGGLTLDPFWATYNSKEALADGSAPLLEQNDHYRPFTQEEIRFIKKIHQLGNVFARNPVLNNVNRLTAYIHKPKIKSVDSKSKSLQRLSASFRISICHPDEKNCQYGSLAGHITITINDDVMKRLFDKSYFSDEEGFVYLEPADFRETWSKELKGGGAYPVLTSGDFVFAKNNRFETLWSHDVTYARAYRYYLTSMKKEFEQCKKDVEKQRGEEPASADDVFAKLKGILSDEEIAKQRVQYEAMRAKTQPDLKAAAEKAQSACDPLESKYQQLKNEYDTLSSKRKQGLARILRPDSPKLKALKPEQMMPVYFAAPDDPDGLHTVTTDWNYFSDAAPRTDIQLIAVSPWWKKGFHNAVIHEVVKAQDWDAVFRFVE